MLLPPDSSAFYHPQATYSHRPLDITTIHGLATQIHRICVAKNTSWALIEGAAVALHLKLCLSSKSFRPKDRWDCRLLIESGLANIDAITWWLRETVSDRQIRDDAQRNIDRLLPLPIAA